MGRSTHLAGLENRGAEAVAAEVEMLRDELVAMQQSLRNQEDLRLMFQAKYEAIVANVLPLLAKASPRHEINIGHLTGSIFVEDSMTGDTFNSFGPAVVVGPHAHVHDNLVQQGQAGIEFARLAEELARLRMAMEGERTGSREQDEAIEAVAKAEKAAANRDDSAVLRHLKAAGRWALVIAEQIGVPVAMEVMKKAL